MCYYLLYMINFNLNVGRREAHRSGLRVASEPLCKGSAARVREFGDPAEPASLVNIYIYICMCVYTSIISLYIYIYMYIYIYILINILLKHSGVQGFGA